MEQIDPGKDYNDCRNDIKSNISPHDFLPPKRTNPGRQKEAFPQSSPLKNEFSSTLYPLRELISILNVKMEDGKRNRFPKQKHALIEEIVKEGPRLCRGRSNYSFIATAIFKAFIGSLQVI